MASILDRYGIKEVADVTFYEIDKTSGEATKPVLYLDTLKVSTIEQTAEQVDARGGKGNPRLVTWDYNKDITVTLEDALFSAKSMAVMFGNGTVAQPTETSELVLKKTISFRGSDVPTKWEGPEGKTYTIDTADAVIYDATGVSTTTPASDGEYFYVFNVKTKNMGVIEIDSKTFPGTYYVTGDTYARSEINGQDEFFQFIIPKAKMSAENTITLEAEGDPSVFNLNLTVLKASGKPLMKLVKYDIDDSTSNG